MRAKIAGIYKITSPTGKVYIGQSYNILRRWASYKSFRCKGQPAIFGSLKKYGSEQHQYIIVHELPYDISQDIMNEYEILYIELHKNGGFKLLNLKDGGDKGKLSKESCNKIRNSNKGKKRTIEQRLNISLSMMGKEYHGKNNGKVRTEEMIEKNRQINLNRTKYKGENHPMAKISPKIVLEIREKFIPRAYSSRRLAKEYNLSKTNILDIIHKRIWKNI